MLPALVASCAPEAPSGSAEPDAPDNCEVALDWGHGSAQQFVPYSDGDDAEITLGFQGFRFIESVLRLEGLQGDRGSYSARVSVQGHDPYMLPATPVELTVGPNGSTYAENARIFFNDLAIADIVGRQAEIAVAFTTALGCTGRTTREVVLRDDETCIETSDGGLSCSDS
jgi:hypothetical protein